MKITRDYIMKLPPGAMLTMFCSDAANLDSVYQMSLKAKKLNGLTDQDIRIKRFARELKVEVERKEVTNEPS
ncbi:MAG: hypothetical protein NC095_06560 [Muribaculum sp.]|nr:hypothetical protein [Muribaculum sp.]